MPGKAKTWIAFQFYSYRIDFASVNGNSAAHILGAYPKRIGVLLVMHQRIPEISLRKRDVYIVNDGGFESIVAGVLAEAVYAY